MEITHKQSNIPLLLSWVLVFLSLSLIIWSGLYSDDFWGFIMRHEEGGADSLGDIVSMSWADVSSEMGKGRVTPIVYFFMEFFYWVAPTILAFKLVILAMNLLAVFMFTRFLKSFGLGAWIPVALLLYCPLIQFYVNFNDAFTSLHAMYPTLTVFLFAALILMRKHLQTGKPYLLAAAMVLALVIIFYSEVGVVIFPVFLVLIAADSRSFRQKVAIFSPALILAIIYVIAVGIVRAHTTVFYSGVKANWFFPAVSKVFAIQTFATLPFKSFVATDALPPFSDMIYPFASLVALMTAAFCFFYRSAIRIALPRLSGRLAFGLIGIILLFMPPSMLMLSKKYQEQLHFGMGYLPVYVQSFGLVMLLLLLLDYLFVRYADLVVRIRVVTFIGLFLLSVGSLYNNCAMIRTSNKEAFIPMTTFCKSLKGGIADSCQPGSVIVVRVDYYGYGLGYYEHFIKGFNDKGYRIIDQWGLDTVGSHRQGPYYILDHDKYSQVTTLYKLLSDNSKIEVKRFDYNHGKPFSYFDLISTPL